jgi:Flp pilus assembly protein TadB
MKGRTSIRGLMLVIAAVAVVLGAASFFLTMQTRVMAERARAEAVRAYLEQKLAMQARADAAKARRSAQDAAQAAGATAPDDPGRAGLEQLRRENAALKAQVRELEEKFGVSGDRPAPAPGAAPPSPNP